MTYVRRATELRNSKMRGVVYEIGEANGALWASPIKLPRVHYIGSEPRNAALWLRVHATRRHDGSY
jgi:hypothetical protein